MDRVVDESAKSQWRQVGFRSVWERAEGDAREAREDRARCEYPRGYPFLFEGVMLFSAVAELCVLLLTRASRCHRRASAGRAAGPRGVSRLGPRTQ
jgi:hypothetical protein